MANEFVDPHFNMDINGPNSGQLNNVYFLYVKNKLFGHFLGHPVF